jgi:hypothetical protein
MIGSEQRRSAAMLFGVFQFEPFIKIDVIEMYEGQHAGISARALQAQSDVSTLKMLVQQLCDQPSCPFVEVADPLPRHFDSRFDWA